MTAILLSAWHKPGGQDCREVFSVMPGHKLINISIVLPNEKTSPISFCTITPLLKLNRALLFCTIQFNWSPLF
jgi:hypothetical protein